MSKRTTAIRLAVLIAGITILRLVIAAALPLGDDETFYWLWAKHPAVCYYDHPGFVAWLIMGSLRLFGNSSFAVRLPTVLVSTVMLWVAYDLARRLFDERVGLWTAMILVIVPVFALGGVLVSTDAIMAVFWFLTIRMLAEATIFENRLCAYAAGVTLGLALDAKDTSILLVPGIVLYLLTSRRTRQEFARKEIYIAAVTAFLIFLPVFLWNAHHGFTSFEFNLSGREHYRVLRISTFLQLIGMDMLFLSPPVFIGLVATFFKLAKLRNLDPRYRLLFWFSVPSVVVFWGASFLTHINAYWPTTAYLTLVIGGCALALGAAGRPARRSWVIAAAAVATLMSALLYIQPFYPLVPIPVKADNTKDLYGWNVVTPIVQRALTSIGGPKKAFLCADRYQFAAQLAYNLDLPYRSFSLNPALDQFDYWIKPHELLGHDAVLVWEEHWGVKPEVLNAFASVRQVASVPIYRQGKHIRTFHILICHDLKYIP